MCMGNVHVGGGVIMSCMAKYMRFLRFSFVRLLALMFIIHIRIETFEYAPTPQKPSQICDVMSGRKLS